MTSIRWIARRLALGLVLIAAASAALLLSDIQRRSPGSSGAGGGDEVPLSRRWKVDFIHYASTLDSEEAEQGVREGLQEAGLVEGRDYEVRVRNALGDMATVTSLIDAAVSDGVDLIVTYSTPTLQAAIRRARSVPIVFTLVANAMAAGAGTSDTEHLPNVTGVYHMAAYDELLAVIAEVMPSARRLGTLYVPAEANTVYHHQRMNAAATSRGYTLRAVAANTSAEVPEAALSLVISDIDAVSQIPGNLTSASFPSLAQAARRARKPIFANSTSQAHGGAIVAVSRDYHDGGRESALIAARIMRGASPAAIPFHALQTTRITVNLPAARELGIAIPKTIRDRADTVIE